MPSQTLYSPTFNSSDGVSFEIFERYQLKCPIIFTTAYDEYAIKALKSMGLDLSVQTGRQRRIKESSR